jgi:hypothetical protein
MQSHVLTINNLRRRLQTGARLREDHVWCLAKQAFPQLCSANNPAGKRFAAFLDASALLDALLLALSVLRPSVSIEAMRKTCHGWMCSASLLVNGALRKAVGRHVDLEGAVFIALLAILKLQRKSPVPPISQTGEND